MRGAAGEWIVLLAAAFALWESAARVGAGAGALLVRPSRDPLERFGMGLLLGWSILGVTYLGLALTGLYGPQALIGALVALTLSSRGGLRPESLVLAAARRTGSVCGRGTWLLLAAGVPAALFLFTPESEPDGLVYHLGAPWQYLQAHRAVYARMPGGCALPLPTEMAFGLSLIFGDERLAKWIVASYLVAASALALGGRGGRTGSTHDWLALLLMGVGGETVLLATSSKNDVAAASLVVAGMLLVRRARWCSGTLLLGLGIAAKPIHVPVAVLWCAVHARRTMPWREMLLGAGLPSLPWLAKAWLVSANVGVPAGWLSAKSAWIKATPVSGGPGFPDTWINYELPIFDAADLMRIPGRWLDLMARDHLAVLLVLPGLLWFGRSRRGVAAILLAQGLVLELLDTPRFLMPAQWMLTWLAVGEAPQLSARWRNVAVPLAAGYAMLQLAGSPSIPWRNAPDGLRTLSSARDARFAAFGTMLGQLHAARPRGTLLVAEPRVYRVPGRTLFEGNRAESPLIWKIAHASTDLAGFNRRWRQSGADLLVYNLVSANYHLIAAPEFPWTPRMIVLYREFVRRHLRIVATPPSVGSRGGAYVLYRWDRRGTLPARRLPYLPGTEQMFSPAAQLMQRGDYAGAVAALQALHDLYPDLGRIASALGDALWLAGKPEPALRAYREAAAAGVTDLAVWFQLGASAETTGRLAEAVDAFRAARALYPDLRVTIDGRLATLQFSLGEREGAARRWAAAERLFRGCVAALDTLPASRERTESLAVARVRLAAALLHQGRPAEAADQITLAAHVLPNVLRDPEAAAIWKAAGGGGGPVR